MKILRCELCGQAVKLSDGTTKYYIAHEAEHLRDGLAKLKELTARKPIMRPTEFDLFRKISTFPHEWDNWCVELSEWERTYLR